MNRFARDTLDNYFQKFIMMNRFARDTLDGFPFAAIDFRDAYHQALLNVPIKEDEEAYVIPLMVFLSQQLTSGMRIIKPYLMCQ
jgi:hypothetical protein